MCSTKNKIRHEIPTYANRLGFFAYGGERMKNIWFVAGFILTLITIEVTEAAIQKSTSKSNG